MNIKIAQQDIGKRIDIFLTEILDDYSRSKVQKLIKDQYVLVNKKETSAHYPLKEWDNITMTDEKLRTSKKKEVFLKKLTNDQKNKNIHIVKETNDYLVVNKPAGLIVHGAAHISDPTLVDLLLAKYPKIKNIGEDKMRPGIVHRLDKDASGLMVIAKNQKLFQDLKKQFQTRKIHKEYTALVFGALSRDYGVINFPIKRSTKGHKMAAIPSLINSDELLITNGIKSKIQDSKQGKEAITEFEVAEKFINYTLLNIKIKTGRTHQIRAHMAAYGHPIVGDDLYGTKRTRILNKKINLGRIFLVARKLGFYNLDKEFKKYSIDLPNELKLFLKKVK